MDANIFLNDQFNTEYQLLNEYCSRRKPKSRGTSAFSQLKMYAGETRVRKKKEKHSVRSPARARCAVDTDGVDDDNNQTGGFGDVADNLTQIVESSHLVPNDLETDSGENASENVIQRLVELLKESGDELNEKIKKDRELVGYLQSSFSYSVFEKLASAFIGSAVPPQSKNQDVVEQKTQIAWTFEMTSRLTALDLHPMNRAMGFGAQYLHQNFAQWIQQHGGWEKVFNRDESDDVE